MAYAFREKRDRGLADSRVAANTCNGCGTSRTRTRARCRRGLCTTVRRSVGIRRAHFFATGCSGGGRILERTLTSSIRKLYSAGRPAAQIRRVFFGATRSNASRRIPWCVLVRRIQGRGTLWVQALDASVSSFSDNPNGATFDNARRSIRGTPRLRRTTRLCKTNPSFLASTVPGIRHVVPLDNGGGRIRVRSKCGRMHQQSTSVDRLFARAAWSYNRIDCTRVCQ